MERGRKLEREGGGEGGKRKKKKGEGVDVKGLRVYLINTLDIAGHS